MVVVMVVVTRVRRLWGLSGEGGGDGDGDGD